MVEKFEMMSKKQMEKLVAKHQILLDKIKKEYNINEDKANQAIDIACDFNLQNEQDLMETLMVIVHTIKRIED